MIGLIILLVLALALGIAIHFAGADHVITAAWGALREFSGEARERFRIWFTGYAAPRTAWLHLSAALLIFTLSAFAKMIGGNPSVYWKAVEYATAAGFILNILAALWLFFYCIPAFQRDADGMVLRYPRYMNVDGVPLNANGIPVPCERLPLNPELAIPHPFGGQRIPVPAGRTLYPDTVLDDMGEPVLAQGHAIPHPYAGLAVNAEANRHFPMYVHNVHLHPIGHDGQLIPDRLGEPLEPGIAQRHPLHGQPVHIAGSFRSNFFRPVLHISIILLSIAAFGVAASIAGVAMEGDGYWRKFGVTGIGGTALLIPALFVLAVLQIFGWMTEKATKLTEYLLTIATAAAPERVRRIMGDRPVNIFEEELNRETINKIALVPFIAIAEHLVFVVPFPYPIWAVIITTFFIIMSFRGWRFARAGGSLEVEMSNRRLMRILYYGWAAVATIKIAWELFSEDLRNAISRPFSHVYALMSGDACVPIEASWWRFLGFIAITAFLAWICANKSTPKSRWFLTPIGVFIALFGLASLWEAVEIIGTKAGRERHMAFCSPLGERPMFTEAWRTTNKPPSVLTQTEEESRSAAPRSVPRFIPSHGRAPKRTARAAEPAFDSRPVPGFESVSRM